MTEIKSNSIVIQNSAENIYEFLSDFNNFGKLMPEQVINWKSDVDSCSFTIKGMADLAMRIGQTNKYTLVSYKSEGKKPFAFVLNSHLTDQGEENTEVQIILSAELNPMLKMMASKPLNNFVNILVEKLKELLEKKT